MKHRYGIRVLTALTFVFASGLCDLPAALAQGGEAAVVTGEVVEFSGESMKVKGAGGDILALSMPENLRVTALAEITFSELKPNDYVAISAVEHADGTLEAIGVRIFPEQLRGVAEGHHPYPGGPNNRMTNATVESLVGEVTGRTFKVIYQGGEKVVKVPENVPVMRMGPGNPDMLKPGAHVSIFAQRQPDGSIKAARVSVGTGGLVPPI